ncbi:Cilia- and flagella-associated protein 47, partial [Phlyctochytrium bullatum]
MLCEIRHVLAARPNPLSQAVDSIDFPQLHVPSTQIQIAGSVIPTDSNFYLTGKLKKLTEAQAIKFALEYVAKEATQGDTSALTVTDYYVDGFGAHHVFISRVIDGVKVDNLVGAVHLDASGKIVMASTTATEAEITSSVASFFESNSLSRRSENSYTVKLWYRRGEDNQDEDSSQQKGDKAVVPVGPVDATVVVATALGYNVSTYISNLTSTTEKIRAPVAGYPDREIIKISGFPFTKRPAEVEFVGYLSSSNEVIPAWRVLLQSKRSLYNVVVSPVTGEIIAGSDVAHNGMPTPSDTPKTTTIKQNQTEQDTEAPQLQTRQDTDTKLNTTVTMVVTTTVYPIGCTLSNVTQSAWTTRFGHDQTMATPNATSGSFPTDHNIFAEVNYNIFIYSNYNVICPNHNTTLRKTTVTTPAATYIGPKGPTPTYRAIPYNRESFASGGQALLLNPSSFAISPMGWHSSLNGDGTWSTYGNNAAAGRGNDYANSDRKGLFGARYDATKEPENSVEAAIVNAFYITNIYHIHELTHGLTSRLIGGPNAISCISSREARGMSEGWSDMVAVLFSTQSTHTRNTNRYIAAYSLGDPEGVRYVPYTSRMDLNDRTYAVAGDIIKSPDSQPPHVIGEVWASMLFEVYWNMITSSGFTPKLLDDAKTGTGNRKKKLAESKKAPPAPNSRRKAALEERARSEKPNPNTGPSAAVPSDEDSVDDGPILDLNEGKNKVTTISKTASKTNGAYQKPSEPDLNPAARATIFSKMSSVSYLSHQSAKVRENLDGYFSVRVDPPEALILDYEPGSRHSRRIVLKNFSDHVQKVRLHPPQTKRFRLTGTAANSMDEILIAPGLSADIDIEFLAPNSSTSVPVVPPNTANARPTRKSKMLGSSTDLQRGSDNIRDTSSLLDISQDYNSRSKEKSGPRGMSLFGPSATSQNTSSGQSDPSSRLYEDILRVEIHGTQTRTITVPIKAYPAGPRLCFKKLVDFGVVVHGLDGGEGAKVKSQDVVPVSKSGKALKIDPSLKDAVAVRSEDPIAVDYFEIRNVGRRAARFRLAYNPHAPLKITPETVNLGISDGGPGQLGLPDSVLVKVEFFYARVGKFREKVKIELENSSPMYLGDIVDSDYSGSGTHSNDHKEPELSFHVSATVVNHKLRLRNQDNTHDIDPQYLNFGIIYYSQCARLPAKLENRGPTVIKWVITHAGESLPMVPSSYRGKPLEAIMTGNASALAGVGADQSLRTARQADAENKASMSVIPSEGVLAPYETSDITFNFAPRIEEESQGFSVTRKGAQTHLFKVPMQLKIIASALDSGADGKKTLPTASKGGEEPIDIVMSGKACPIEASLSTEEIEFGDIVKDSDSEVFREVTLRNNSSHLGFRFRFSTAAHFHMYPSSGSLGPLSSIPIRVVFKPNQLGRFKSNPKCIISSIDDMPTFEISAGANSNSPPLMVRFAGDASSRDIYTLTLRLKGTCRPPKQAESPLGAEEISLEAKLIHGKDSECLSLIKKTGKHLGHRRSLSDGGGQGLEEWVEKSQNKHLYWDYLKSSRTERLIRERQRRFGDDGVIVKLDKVLTDDYVRNIDVENGLVAPEPVDFLKAYGAKSYDGNGATREHMPEDTRKIRMLFQQLLEPSASRAKSLGSPGHPSLPIPADKSGAVDVPLTGADLANFYTASSSLDFGEVTVHSGNSRPLNFLNISPNRVPIHIRLLVDKDGVPDALTETDDSWSLKVLPPSLVLQPMSVAGVEVTFQSHKPGIFNQKITYLVNGRYKYQMPVKVKVNPLQLALSTSKITLEIPPNANFLSHGRDHGPEGAGDTTPATPGMHSSSQKNPSIPWAEQTFTLFNKGNHAAGFHWLLPESSIARNEQDIPGEGSFLIDPIQGSIPPKGSIELKITFIPGIKPVYEEDLVVQVIDEAELQGVPKVSGELVLSCRGEIASSSCILLHSAKQQPGPIDFGVLSVLSTSSAETDPYSLASYNTFALQDLFAEPATATHTTHAGTHNSTGKPVATVATTSKGMAGTQLSGHHPSSVNSKGWRTIRIKNTSSNPCFFTAHTVKGDTEVDVFPRSGSIQGSGGILELTLVALPTRVARVEDAIAIAFIGGGRVLRVPFKYESREPKVEVFRGLLKPSEPTPNNDVEGEEDEATEPGTVVGSWSTTPIVLSNTGSVVARGVIDLRKLPEFKISLNESKDDHAQVGGHGGGSIRASSAPGRKSLKQNSLQHNLISVIGQKSNFERFKVLTPEDELYNFRDTDIRKLIARPASPRRSRKSFYSDSENPVERQGNIYVFELQAGEKLHAELVFSPFSCKKLLFDIPVRIIGMTSVPKIDVDVQSVPSPITVSRTSINFKNKVVFRDSGIMGVSHLKNVTKEVISITNNSDRRISWSFDIDPLEDNQCPFKLDPWRATLDPGASQNINILFQPERIGLFESSLPLHIDFLGRHAPFVLSLQGTGVEPSIAFEPCEIYLPLIPIGVEASATFSIVNYGCERTEIKHLISEDAVGRGGHLELQFPEGKLLKSDGEKLTVVLKFSGTLSLASGPGRNDPNGSQLEAKKDGPSKPYGPISFTTKIEFSDNNHRTFYLPVHGTSDNSALTLHTYFWRTRSEFKFSLSEQPLGHITYVSKKVQAAADDNQRRTRIINAPRPLRTPLGIPVENTDIDNVDIFLSQTGEMLVRWLEDHLPPGSVHADVWKKEPGSLKERVRLISQQYKDLLNFLVAAGAFASNVRPEFLMSHEDFKRAISAEMDNVKSDSKGILHDETLEYYRKLDSIYPIIQKEAWITILLQIIKVYVAGIVTVKHFRSLPGVSTDEMEMNWPVVSKSNVFSTSDYLLLRWVSYHMWKRSGVLRRLCNFTEDFKTSVALASLILSHLPQLEATHFSFFYPLCENTEQLEANCRIVNAALNDIFHSSATALPVDRVVRGEAALEIQMLLLFLYQTLPNFLAKACVDFRGGLHDKVTRGIEISNPSARSLTYTATLAGSVDFSLVEGANLTIPPKSQAKIPVQFASRFAAQADGQLKLQTRRVGLNNTSILVFNLIGFVNAPVPRRVFKIDAPMYCTPPATLDLEISTPFSVPGRFKVTLKQSKESGYVENVNPPTFKALERELYLEPTQTKFFSIAFQPFEAGLHECTLHFVDENVGEFIYQVDGKALAPQAIDCVWTCKAGTALEKPIRITPVNLMREKALYSQQQRRQPAKDVIRRRDDVEDSSDLEKDSYQLPRRPLKYRVEYLSPFFSGPSEITVRPLPETVKEKRTLFELDQNYTELPLIFKPKLPGKYSCKVIMIGTEVSDVRVFSVLGVAIAEGSKAELEFSIPVRQSLTQDIPIVNKTDEEWNIKATLQGQYFNGPATLVVPAHSVTNYPITFKPQRPAEVDGVLTISNLHTAQKHVYHLKGTGQEPLPEERIEIRCSVRDKVKEILQVTNYTDADAEYDVVTDIPFSTFTPKVSVAAGQTEEHVLEITPRRSGIFKYLVTYINRADQSYIWFTVHMAVRPPPSEDTLKLSTTVRKAVAVEVPIANPLGVDATFDVSYVGDGLSGPQTITVKAKSEALYSLSYAPITSAVQSGRILFQSEQIGEFWYNLVLEANEAPPILLPDMAAPLGKCATQTITIQNIFPMPTRLDLHLKDSPPQFQLQHPPVASHSDITRKPRTQASTLVISLKPMERADVQIVFWPSSLTEPSKGLLHVVSSSLGNSTYHVQGTGLLPEPMDELVVRSPLHHTVSSILSFTNPLLDPIAVTVTVRDADGRPITYHPPASAAAAAVAGALTATPAGSALANLPEISLMLHRKQRYTVGGLEKLEIPFMYCPKRMDRSLATISVEMGKLKWLYPIMGVPDFPISNAPQPMECRSRETLEGDLQVVLRGYLFDADADDPTSDPIPSTDPDATATPPGSATVDLAAWNSRLEVSLVPAAVSTHGHDAHAHAHAHAGERLLGGTEARGGGGGHAADVAKWVQVVLKDVKRVGKEGVALLFKSHFSPTKPSDHLAHLTITQHSTGARWRFPLRLISHPPPIDDTITIEGRINKTTGVSFVLRNTAPHARAFRAFFTKESAGELGVSPTSGTLVTEREVEEGKPENRFVVTYRAATYGKNVTGTLIIESDDISWSYTVHGVTPKSHALASSTSIGSFVAPPPPAPRLGSTVPRTTNPPPPPPPRTIEPLAAPPAPPAPDPPRPRPNTPSTTQRPPAGVAASASVVAGKMGRLPAVGGGTPGEDGGWGAPGQGVAGMGRDRRRNFLKEIVVAVRRFGGTPAAR